MIKRITNVQNMGVLDGFDWDANVQDANSRVSHFKDINLIYGRNYSGKTTLSRIVASLETGVLPKRFDNLCFLVEDDIGGRIDQNRLINHPLTIRVFNKDFVARNLSFIVDEESDIKPFAVLGEDNTKIEQEIQQKVSELGSAEDKTGLQGALVQAKGELDKANTAASKAEDNLNDKLRKKATDRETGIKYNSNYGDPSYNTPKLTDHLDIVNAPEYSQLKPEDVSKQQSVLEEKPKDDLSEAKEFRLKFQILCDKAKEVCERNVTSSERIMELVENNDLASWVRDGISHHKDKRAKCAFCGGDIKAELWVRLAKHFNKESEALRSDIESLLGEIASEKSNTSNLLSFDSNSFYSEQQVELEILKSSYEAAEKAYVSELDNLATQVEQRANDIFTPIVWIDIADPSAELEEVRVKYNNLVKTNNDSTKTLKTRQNEAKELLRLHEIRGFSNDIDYLGTKKSIAKLQDAAKTAKDNFDTAQNRVTETQASISELQAELKDERKGAERVNHYLNHYFGHESLSLNANESDEGTHFEVLRNGDRAYHLSEGECSLIGFCYFIAKLDEVDTAGNNPIIWIDDPISSLDGNHVFYVFSLIDSAIVHKGCFEQLFISTHNMEFFSYLLRLRTKDINSIKRHKQHFVIERQGVKSKLTLMPLYMKENATEFNYLFHQIYKAAIADENASDSYGIFCQFGNNARKFTEALLYFKYPDGGGDGQLERLSSFLGDTPLGASLLNRINNEYSHLKKRFERGTTVLDVPEIKKVARYLLNRIENNDAEQYASLLKSVGESPIMDDTNE